MKSFATRYPWLLVVLSSLALLLCQYVWLFWLPGLNDFLRSLCGKVTSCLLAILLVGRLGWWKETGLTVRWRWRMLIPFLPLAIIPLLSIIFQLDKFKITDPVQIGIFGLLALMTGFAEETIFRGIAVQAFAPKGIMQAAIFSSLIFGLVHYANLLVGADPLATCMQVVFAFLFGMAFSAPMLYTGSIWPLVVLHALQDFIAFWTTGSLTNTATPAISEILTTITLMLPFAGYGIWLLRRKLRKAFEESEATPTGTM